MKLSVILAIASLTALLSNPSSAQQADSPSTLPPLISEGDVISGVLGTSSRKTANGLPFACYVFDAPAGSAWEIDLRGDRQTRLWVARGDSCDTISSWDLESSGSGGFVGTTEFSRAKFLSGGGAYFIVARMYDGKNGRYTLEVRRTEEGGRKLKPGAALEQLAYLSETETREMSSSASTAQGPTPLATTQLAQTSTQGSNGAPKETARRSLPQEGMYEAQVEIAPNGPQALKDVIRMDGEDMWFITPFGRLKFTPLPNGDFAYFQGDKIFQAMRVLNEHEVELYFPQHDKTEPVRYVRKSAIFSGLPEIANGYFLFKNPEPLWKDKGWVIQTEGDVLYTATPNSVGEYYRQPDGTYHSKASYTGDRYIIRALDAYTFEHFLQSGKGKRLLLTRANGAEPTYVAEARHNQTIAIQRHDAENDRLMALWEEEMAADEEWREAQREEALASQPTTNSMGVLGGFMKGLSEATAKNDAMEQSMTDSRNEAIARGRAEYARRQAEESRQLADQRAAAAERAQIAREQQAAFARQEKERLAAAERTRLARLEQEIIPQASSQVGSTVGSASTDTDANRCVTTPEVTANAEFQGNTSASVMNGCGQPVDVLICLKRANDWNCGTDNNVQPQAAAIHSSFNATGPIHVDAKTTGNSRPYVYPSN